jgi:hypothetical protein
VSPWENHLALERVPVMLTEKGISKVAVKATVTVLAAGRER